MLFLQLYPCLHLCKSLQEGELATTRALRTMQQRSVPGAKLLAEHSVCKANSIREIQLSINQGCNFTWSSYFKKNATQWKGSKAINTKTT